MVTSMNTQETYEEIITILESLLEENEDERLKATARYNNNLKKEEDRVNNLKDGGQQILLTQQDIENSALGATKTTNASQARKSNFTKDYNKRHANDEKPKEPEHTQLSLFCSLMDVVEEYLGLFEGTEGIMHYVKKHGGNKERAFQEYIKDRNKDTIEAAKKKVETEKKAKILSKKRMKGDIDIVNTADIQDKAYNDSRRSFKDLLNKGFENHKRNLRIPSLKDKLITVTQDSKTGKEGLQVGSEDAKEIKNIRRQ